MSCLKFTLVRWGGVLAVALAAAEAMAQSPAPPRDSGTSWDGGPVPGRPAGPPRGNDPRRLDAQDDGRMPLGPPNMGPRGDGRQPSGEDLRRGSARGGLGDRRSPLGRGGPEGPDMQPPGPPPGMWMDLETLRIRDPELYKLTMEDRDLERQSRDQSQQFRRADKDAQAKIKEKLAAIVDKHFAVRQQLRTLEVKRLEQQVKQLRDRIDAREKNRMEIVGKRISELIGTDDEEHF